MDLTEIHSIETDCCKIFEDDWRILPLMCQSAGNCTNHVLDFDKVFSVPGEMAMLTSTLVTSKVFNYPADPYNVTWYDMKTGREVSSEPGRILVRGETLWFLNVTMDDHGEYVSVLRYGSGEAKYWPPIFSPLKKLTFFLFIFILFYIFFYQNFYSVLQTGHHACGGATSPRRLQ